MWWSQQTTLLLIEDLHSNPCLWDVHCEAYRNRTNKIDVLNALGNKYGVSAVEVEKKIQSLKIQFRREHKKLLNSSRNELSPIKVNWFGYERLLFLLRGYEPRGLTDEVQGTAKEIVDKLMEGNDTDGNEEDSENETCTSESSAIELTSKDHAIIETNMPQQNEFMSLTKHRKKKIDENSHTVEVFKWMKTLTETVSARDEYTVYGEHIANKLRNSGRSKLEIAIAQCEINNVCFKLAMGGFTEMTHSLTQSLPSSQY